MLGAPGYLIIAIIVAISMAYFERAYQGSRDLSWSFNYKLAFGLLLAAEGLCLVNAFILLFR